MKQKHRESAQSSLYHRKPVVANLSHVSVVFILSKLVPLLANFRFGVHVNLHSTQRAVSTNSSTAAKTVYLAYASAGLLDLDARNKLNQTDENANVTKEH